MTHSFIHIVSLICMFISCVCVCVCVCIHDGLVRAAYATLTNEHVFHNSSIRRRERERDGGIKRGEEGWSSGAG